MKWLFDALSSPAWWLFLLVAGYLGKSVLDRWFKKPVEWVFTQIDRLLSHLSTRWASASKTRKEVRAFQIERLVNSPFRREEAWHHESRQKHNILMIFMLTNSLYILDAMGVFGAKIRPYLAAFIAIIILINMVMLRITESGGGELQEAESRILEAEHKAEVRILEAQIQALQDERQRSSESFDGHGDETDQADSPTP